MYYIENIMIIVDVFCFFSIFFQNIILNIVVFFNYNFYKILFKEYELLILFLLNLKLIFIFL